MNIIKTNAFFFLIYSRLKLSKSAVLFSDFIYFISKLKDDRTNTSIVVIDEYLAYIGIPFVSPKGKICVKGL